jgi:hypothetical protein
LAQTNGFGSAFLGSKYSRIACSSFLVDLRMTRRMHFSVRVANQRSTWFGQAAKAGVNAGKQY